MIACAWYSTKCNRPRPMALKWKYCYRILRKTVYCCSIMVCNGKRAITAVTCKRQSNQHNAHNSTWFNLAETNKAIYTNLNFSSSVSFYHAAGLLSFFLSAISHWTLDERINASLAMFWRRNESFVQFFAQILNHR